MKKILVLIDLNSEHNRVLLREIVNQSKKFGNYVFMRVPSHIQTSNNDKDIIKWAKKWKPDAIIAHLRTKNVEKLKELNIPIIIQNYEERSIDVSNLTGDYKAAGLMAANFFIERGFKNFAFYGSTTTVWSRERAEGYKQEIEKNGNKLQSFYNNQLEEDKCTFDSRKLAKWLCSLPKPIALFACNDQFASHIAETCLMNDISVPDEISILGVDNDELLCNMAEPRLSSIVVDAQNGAYEVVKLLQRLIGDPTALPSNVIMQPIRIEKRESTEKYVVADRQILKVIKHIENKYSEQIDVDDLVELVPMCRRMLERKFKQDLGVSIYQYIQNIRIEQFAVLLQTTTISIAEIAEDCGFSGNKNISQVFLKYKNLTPTQYRQLYYAS